jgi:hypothetical protein
MYSKILFLLNYNSNSAHTLFLVKKTSYQQYMNIHCFAGKLFAGHSKWANIKHIKSEKVLIKELKIL